MFDVGFSEMIVIAIVALVVLGPEKLPKIARTVGKFYGSMQRYMSGFKADIEREVALDNMRKATAEAQQKLLELQSQVKVLSGEIPELAAQAQANMAAGTAVNEVPDAFPTQTPAVQHEPQAMQEVASAVVLDEQAHSPQLAEGVANNPADGAVNNAAAGDAAVSNETQAQDHMQESAKEDEVLWKKKA